MGMSSAIYDLFLYANNSGNVRLENGHLVFGAVEGLSASISDAVVRSAIYELEALVSLFNRPWPARDDKSKVSVA